MKRILRRGSLAALLLALAGWAAAWLVPLPARLGAAGSTLVLWRDGQVAHAFLSPDERWRVAGAEVDPAYIDALIALEDSRFWWHPGVDPLAVLRAAGQNAAAGEVVSGASTITMQLARLLEPRPRTFGAKLLDALRAAQLEARLSKREILDAYLALVPYGRNVEGVAAASLACFGHLPGALTPAEIATLLAIPQSPAARYPSPANAARLRAARDDAAERLLERGALQGDPEQIRAQIRATAVPERLAPLPRDAAHAARYLRARRAGPFVASTLDRGAQATAERLLAQRRAEAGLQGVDHAAIVVVDNATADVVALVGGFDFWSEAPGSQIPAFAVPRSPGSTLKPLLYAHAIERGLALPARLVPDVPTWYGGYSPENFDGQYAGAVTLEDALSRSLNVPFVDLLARVGVEPFLGLLRSGGAESLDPRPGRYGLSLIAGGIELSLLELAELYAALENGGLSRPLRLLADAPAPAARPLVAPGAAWLAGEALARRDRPDFPARAAISAAPRRLRWKTGTSFGYRDALAVGSGQRYTAAVWLGNLDNRPSRWLVGAEAAAPLLFDLLEALGDGRGEAPAPPADLRPVEVCALSGHLPAPACPRRQPVPALADVAPPDRCPYHQQVEIDLESGLSVTPGCRAGRRTQTRTFLAWPASIRRYLSGQRAGPDVPPLAPGCQPVGAPPRIRTPARGQVALLIPGLPADQQEIPFEAEGSAGARLSWFLDGAFLGSAPATERLWWTPRPGEHEVVVVDEAGRRDRAALTVRLHGGDPDGAGM